MLLAGLSRRFALIKLQNEKNYKVTQLTVKLSELQRYAANIGDGTMSMQDMMDMPGSLFGRSMAFMNYSHNGALRGAQQNFQMMTPQIQMQMQQMQNANAQSQQQYQQWIFKNLYQQERQKFAKREEKLLNIQEQEIQKEKAQAETELKMIQAELESLTQHTSEAAKQWKPEYA